MKADEFDTFLDGALTRVTQAPPADDAAVARVLKRLAPPLPRQKISYWRLPAVLLDWQFAPAWPRMAALGACAAVGFAVGITGLDRSIDRLDGQTVNASGMGAGVFEPEPLIGERP